MNIRGRSLPAAWYPGNRDEIERTIDEWEKGLKLASRDVSAAIAPHAGWYFSGKLAWAAWRAGIDADVFVIFGGHRPAGSSLLVSMHDAFDTPLGAIEADHELRSLLLSGLEMEPDRQADNTLEIHLPLAAFRFPKARAVLMRVPNDLGAIELGKRLAELASKLSRRLFVLGSTDLTHYGPSYGFEPGGSGSKGKAWASATDDRIIQAFMSSDEKAALQAANDGGACSVGAALALISYAKSIGARSSTLLGRYSSDEIIHGSSFVGYCGVAYQ